MYEMEKMCVFEMKWQTKWKAIWTTSTHISSRAEQSMVCKVKRLKIKVDQARNETENKRLL